MNDLPIDAVLDRDFFAGETEVRQSWTRPADDAPTMCEAVTLILLDAHLLMRGDSVLQDCDGAL
jgi:hypothetical protein